VGSLVRQQSGWLQKQEIDDRGDAATSVAVNWAVLSTDSVLERTQNAARDRPRRFCGAVVAMIVGVGVDVVDIERFRTVLARTPTLRERVFTAAELAYVAPRVDPVPSLAARFAAREAVMKSLGLGIGAFGYHDVSVDVGAGGAPSLIVSGRAAQLAEQRRAATFHLSLSHDGPVAVAVVVADGGGPA
jgi:holo-[acyl-carrier protein] synthase